MTAFQLRTTSAPEEVRACAGDEATTDAVNASVQLGKDLGVDSTPMLFVNGQPIPLTGIPYEVLKRIVVYRAGLDGVQVKLQPSLKTLNAVVSPAEPRAVIANA